MAAVACSGARFLLVFLACLQPTKGFLPRAFPRASPRLATAPAPFPVLAVRDYREPDLDSLIVLGSDSVGTGCLLIAPKHEYNHFLMEQVVLLYESDETGYRGVILERPTAFTVDEMVPGMDDFNVNYLFTGGEDGGRTVIMVHPHGEDVDGEVAEAEDEQVKYGTTIENSRALGSGLFVGGVEEAKAAVTQGLLPAEDFKFFFNHVRLSPLEVGAMIEGGGWRAVRLPNTETPKLVLRNGDFGLWRTLRKRLGEAVHDYYDEDEEGAQGEAAADQEPEKKELTIEMDYNG